MIPMHAMGVQDPNALNVRQARGRLSNLNPMRTKPRREVSLMVAPVMPASLPSMPFSSSDQNYNLVRIETERSIDSHFSLQLQFRVSLTLSKREIELIRYSWHEMLMDQPGVTKKAKPTNIPGAFPVFGKASNSGNSSGTSGNGNNSGNGNGTSGMPGVTRTSAARVASSLFCRQLYANLLSMDPNLESLFPLIRHQAVAFSGVLSFAVSQLENLSTLDDYLMSLGKRHSRILGIEPASFELMGEALVQTFHERFGNRFSHELEILWIKVYLYLANSILQFGIDPVLRLNDDSNASVFSSNQVYQLLLYNTTSNSTSNNNSNFETSSVFEGKRGSVSTAVTSAQDSAMGSVDAARKPSVSAAPKKSVRASIKKKKDNCVVM